jgi:hypothetical protein
MYAKLLVLRNRLGEILRDKRGAELVEIAGALVLFVLVVFGVMKALGLKVTDAINNVISAI